MSLPFTLENVRQNRIYLKPIPVILHLDKVFFFRPTVHVSLLNNLHSRYHRIYFKYQAAIKYGAEFQYLTEKKYCASFTYIKNILRSSEQLCCYFSPTKDIIRIFLALKHLNQQTINLHSFPRRDQNKMKEPYRILPNPLGGAKFHFSGKNHFSLGNEDIPSLAPLHAVSLTGYIMAQTHSLIFLLP